MSIGIRLITLIGFICLGILIRNVLLLGFISLVFSICLNYPVSFFSKRMPRGSAVSVTLLLLVSAIAGFGFYTFPKIYDQSQSVIKTLPKAISQVEHWFTKMTKSESASPITQGAQMTQHLGSKVETWIESGLTAIFPAAKGMFEILVSLVFVLILAFFLVYQPESYKAGFRKLLPLNLKTKFDTAAERLGQGFGHWVIGILLAMTIMGTFTGAGLAIAGIDDWFFLAILTFFGTFVPYLGALLSAIPGLLIGLSQSFHHFLYAGIIYLCAHILEGYIVEPFIMKKAVEIKPATLLLGQAVLSAIFGVMGIIVAAPLIVFAQILIECLYVEDYLAKKEAQSLNLLQFKK